MSFHHTNHTDWFTLFSTTDNVIPNLIWTIAEPAVAIICACLPLLRPLFGYPPNKWNKAHQRVARPSPITPPMRLLDARSSPVRSSPAVSAVSVGYSSNGHSYWSYDGKWFSFRFFELVLTMAVMNTAWIVCMIYDETRTTQPSRRIISIFTVLCIYMEFKSLSDNLIHSLWTKHVWPFHTLRLSSRILFLLTIFLLLAYIWTNLLLFFTLSFTFQFPFPCSFFSFFILFCVRVESWLFFFFFLLTDMH